MKLLIALLENLLAELKRPGPIYIFMEKVMASKFRLKVLLPPIVDQDVESREMTLKVGDAEPTIQTVPKDTPSLEVMVDQGSHCVFTLIDIDDAGNRSEPSIREFDALDTIAPPKPGEIGIEVLGEIQV